MSGNEKPKILLVFPNFSTFILKDFALLEKNFNVRMEYFPGLKSALKTLPKILKGALWSDLTLSWFADAHAFWSILFSKMFRKKSMVIVGGYEVAKIPEINYGAMLSFVQSRVVRFILDKADQVLTVDDSLKKDAIKNAKIRGNNIQTVPTGYNPEVWKFKGKKEDLVISVGNINRENLKRKGQITFVKTAQHLPHIRFVLIGPQKDKTIDYLRSIASPNIEFPGRIPNEQLPQWYSRAKVYCQLSRYEGLPNSLCEAMLCECVPVGTERCGIPVAIGNTGFYVPYGDEKATAQAIQKALVSDKGKEARERIKELFPLKKREKKLVEIINDLLSGKKQGIEG